MLALIPEHLNGLSVTTEFADDLLIRHAHEIYAQVILYVCAKRIDNGRLVPSRSFHFFGNHNSTSIKMFSAGGGISDVVTRAQKKSRIQVRQLGYEQLVMHTQIAP
jgi:hypothetical protein